MAPRNVGKAASRSPRLSASRASGHPLRQIASNAGLEGSVIVNEAMNRSDNDGFDASTEKWVNMIKARIIDPTKVTLTALHNASSIAGLMLTTEALINEIPEDEKAKAAPSMPGGDMGGMGGMGGMY